MANRLVEEGSDARLEALFGDSPKEAAIPGIKAWEDGAEEVAKMFGAQVRVFCKSVGARPLSGAQTNLSRVWCTYCVVYY